MNELKFTCPKCGGREIEEIQEDVVVATCVTLLQETDISGECCADIDYGEQTNDGGHVVRYQCGGCGYIIVDDTSPHNEEGLDEYALVKAINELNPPVKKGRLWLYGIILIGWVPELTGFLNLLVVSNSTKNLLDIYPNM